VRRGTDGDRAAVSLGIAPILVPPAEPARPLRGSQIMKAAAIGALAAILLMSPAPALGKVPWSSVEVEPIAPIAGEPLSVVVRFWDDASHTRPVTSWPGSDTDGLLELESASERVPLTLTRIGDGAFRAEVTLSTGTWRLIVVQDHSGPTEVEIATVTVAAPEAAPPSAVVPTGAVVIGAALVAAGALWRRRRAPSVGRRSG